MRQKSAGSALYLLPTRPVLYLANRHFLSVTVPVGEAALVRDSLSAGSLHAMLVKITMAVKLLSKKSGHFFRHISDTRCAVRQGELEIIFPRAYND